VNLQKEGTYTVTYDVSDLEGNAAVQKVLTVNIIDPSIQYSVPVINLNSDPIVFLIVGETYTDPGVTCIDTVDGDISDKVEIIMSDVDTSSPGTYYQLYQVYNSGGYYGFNARYVVVSAPGAPVPPVFYLSNYYYPQMVQIGTAYEPQIIRAYDKKDGNITDKVVIGGDTVDSNKEGIYYVTYNVQNSEGLNADQFTIKVVVTDLNNPIDYTAPELQLLGDQFISLNQGDTFTEPGYIATDDRDGDVTARVTVEGSIDTNVAGFYQLTYRVSDNAGNETVRFWDIFVNSPVSYESV
jgi:PKD repeat protein